MHPISLNATSCGLLVVTHIRDNINGLPNKIYKEETIYFLPDCINKKKQPVKEQPEEIPYGYNAP